MHILPPRANGEPLFSSHMLDLSEEFDEENIATCVKYFKVLWSCPNCPSIGDPDIVQFHACGRDIAKTQSSSNNSDNSCRDHPQTSKENANPNTNQ